MGIAPYEYLRNVPSRKHCDFLQKPLEKYSEKEYNREKNYRRCRSDNFIRAKQPKGCDAKL